MIKLMIIYWSVISSVLWLAQFKWFIFFGDESLRAVCWQLIFPSRNVFLSSWRLPVDLASETLSSNVKNVLMTMGTSCVYTQCSSTCNGGRKLRSVDCIDSKGSLVDDAMCASRRKPRENTKCNTHNCDSPRMTWLAGPWEEVSFVGS